MSLDVGWNPASANTSNSKRSELTIEKERWTGSKTAIHGMAIGSFVGGSAVYTRVDWWTRRAACMSQP